MLLCPYRLMGKLYILRFYTFIVLVNNKVSNYYHKNVFTHLSSRLATCRSRLSLHYVKLIIIVCADQKVTETKKKGDMQLNRY